MPEYLVTIQGRAYGDSVASVQRDTANWAGDFDAISVEPIIAPLDENSADFQRALADTVEELGRFESGEERIEWAREVLDTLAPKACSNTDYGILRACQHCLESARRQDRGTGFGRF